jgi:hypothetical protein
LLQYFGVAQAKQASGLLTSGGCFIAPLWAFYQYCALARQFTNHQLISYSWLIHVVHLSFVTKSLAKILIIIELHKLFDTFLVVCGDFVRLFVVILFGCL